MVSVILMVTRLSCLAVTCCGKTRHLSELQTRGPTKLLGLTAGKPCAPVGWHKGGTQQMCVGINACPQKPSGFRNLTDQARRGEERGFSPSKQQCASRR